MYYFFSICLFQELHSPDSVVRTDVSGIFYISFFTLFTLTHVSKNYIMHTVLYTHTFFFARNQTFEDKNVRSDFELCLCVPFKKTSFVCS